MSANALLRTHTHTHARMHYAHACAFLRFLRLLQNVQRAFRVTKFGISNQFYVTIIVRSSENVSTLKIRILNVYFERFHSNKYYNLYQGWPIYDTCAFCGTFDVIEWHTSVR